MILRYSRPEMRAIWTDENKLNLWLQFGGHADGEGDLAAVAQRELIEESGITPAEFASSPFDIDIHPIPAHKDEPAHAHLDVRYLAIAPSGAEFIDQPCQRAVFTHTSFFHILCSVPCLSGLHFHHTSCYHSAPAARTDLTQYPAPG